MKNVIYISLFLVAGTIWSQEKPKNVSEKTIVKTVNTNDGSKINAKEIKVTTREEQNIEFASADENKIDKDIVVSPVKVKKTIKINDDMDNSFNSKSEVTYYEYEGQHYNFSKVNNGFSVLVENNDTPNNFGNIVKFNRENHYLFQNDNDTGIGYFNEDGSFTIEYYDSDTGTITRQEFLLIMK